MFDRLAVALAISLVAVLIGVFLFAFVVPVAISDALSTPRAATYLGEWNDCPSDVIDSDADVCEYRIGRRNFFFVEYSVIQRRELYGDFTKYTGSVVDTAINWIGTALGTALVCFLVECCRRRFEVETDSHSTQS